MKLTEELKKEYEELWNTLEPSTGYSETIAKNICKNAYAYIQVEKKTGVPWYVIGCIHYMEGGLSFNKQLFNGQRWNMKTTWVPKGLGPWNSWHESALEAMYSLNKKMRRLVPGEWDIAKICYAFENHNGFGYRRYHSHVKSPYLWSFSNHYTSGKYIADGEWSDTAISKQMGAMVIIKRIGEITDIFTEPPAPTPDPAPIPSVEIVIPKKKNWLGKVKCWWKDMF